MKNWYYLLGKASEGQVKALTTFPLLELARFYSYPIQINVEEGIDEIEIADEDKIITGRFDIVAVDRARPTVNDVPFWILVIESKECGVEIRQALPQLLTYAYDSLKCQPSVWGLATNGLQHLFVLVEQADPPTYQLLPELHLLEPERSIRLLQVLKAIGKQHFAAT
ncbi:restriction endonuclease subunit R [Leptolyngbya sp. FACHB-36]|uniref:restriction endonuclease subunit R n=1 Tax=Leptolyngbya sp. FACHB-36 TaxID=2692808 RepID=UPI001681B790|nr:restriction endonuclease subunit R [Leptolyngbya sp. FACHB-36]MBD2020686.1 restriction endonuclease subunit R [Leptolyngbya sp. FACHB-36]